MNDLISQYSRIEVYRINFVLTYHYLGLDVIF